MPVMPERAKALLSSRPYQVFVRRLVLPWLLQGQRPAGAGLEIGAGSGIMTAQLLSANPDLHMVATDFDADLVRVAQDALAPYGDRAHVEQADAAGLPFPDGRFDFVLSAAMLHHVLDWEQALAEAVRVLRPGGRLIGYDLLDSGPIRLIHHGEHHETRLMRPGELESHLDRLGLVEVRTRRAVAGAAVRFIATKAAAIPS